MQLGWSNIQFGLGLETGVPEREGVYVLAEVKRQHGLPVMMRVLYVGLSQNLRRRYREHADLHEPNPDLSRLIASGREGIEFWWVVLPASQLCKVERMLIAEFTPKANRIRYRGNK